MKSIVDKLGITPGEFDLYLDESGDDLIIDDQYGNRIAVIVENEKMANLFFASREMLEALIKIIIHAGECFDICEMSVGTFDICKKAIEKATGKTWEEVKEIIENE